MKFHASYKIRAPRATVFKDLLTEEGNKAVK